MLLISIHNGSVSESVSEFREQSARFDMGGRIVTLEIDQPYGFIFERGDTIIAGESLSQLDNHAVDALCKRLSESSENHHLGYGLFVATIFNKATSKLSLYNSVSSSRTYYLFQNRDSLVLSSSLRVMRRHGVELQLNEDALPELMVYRFVSAPNSLVKNVRVLSGGESLEFDLDSFHPVSQRSYDFRLPYEAKAPDIKSARQKAEQLLTSNIADSLSPSKRPGMLLSGGLDSSLLGVLAVKNGDRPDSVSSGFSFANKDDRETDYATTVADHIGVEHRLFEGNEELYLSGLVEAVYHAEMPLHHLQSVMLYLLFKDAHIRGNDLFLCGEAADGLFGNDAHQRCHKFDKINSVLNIPPLRSIIRMSARVRPNDYRLSFFSHDFSTQLNNDRHYLYNLGQYTRSSLVNELFGYDLHRVVASHQLLMQPFGKQPLLNQISIISLLCEGAVTMSVWSKLAAASAIKIAYPFASENMIDHVYGVPWNQKLRQPKYLVREMLRANGFKEEFITRPKRSFGFPIDFWALPNKLFQPLVDMASEKYDPHLLKQLQKADMSHAMLLWNLLSIYLFEMLIIKEVDHTAFSEDLLVRHRKMTKRKSA
jgi:asparagine synthetase B (glutamine-hydrolysing)